MPQGKVTHWNGQTGFIVDSADQARVFFGDRDLRGIQASQIQVGMILSFNRRQGDRGPRAGNVQPIGSATTTAHTSPASSSASRPRETQKLDVRSHAPTEWVVPRRTQAVIRQVRIEDRHPVIQLDRLSIPGDQQAQRDALNHVTRTHGDNRVLNEALARRHQLLTTLAPFQTWTMQTCTPLTLHLSRTNGLENAGLALHPVYGFAYLPGSGLKGMARAAATLELGVSHERVREIFGNEPGEHREGKQGAGAVVFHDAWPTAWPSLFVDIVTNHHADYYEGKDAPGDWEAPNPVNFLAVAAKTEFSFLLTARRRDVSPQLMADATKCLQAALSLSGAGAKTAAGYGWFTPLASSDSDDIQASSGTSLRRTFEVTLISPAFLAGAEQSSRDCELRSATLRGQLRTWWRTLHAGCIQVQELRELEAALWGSTNVGSAIRISVEPLGQPVVRPHEHPQARDSGVRYLAYGMDDGRLETRVRRMRMEPGMRWKLKVSCRASKFGDQPISAEQVCRQFEAAFGLLIEYGGVGAKGRKGFGSLGMVDIVKQLGEVERWKSAANELRSDLGLSTLFHADWSQSAALFDPSTRIMQLTCNGPNALSALEQAGQAYKSVAYSFKHQAEKVTLGLPRKIHGPNRDPLPHQQGEHRGEHPAPVPLTCVKTQDNPADGRHSSPIHLHIAQTDRQTWQVRVVLFPMAYLPNRPASIQFETKFAERFEAAFAKAGQGPQTAGQAKPTAQVRQSGPTVEVVLLEEKVLGGKTGFKVQEEGKPPGMLVHGTPPSTLPKVGDKAMVYWVSTSDAKSPIYRWTPPEAPAPKRPPNRR